MERLREALDDRYAARQKPTRFETRLNKHEVRCGVCDRLFYVDESTYERVRSAIEFDPTDNPFRCDDCEEEYAELAAG